MVFGQCNANKHLSVLKRTIFKATLVETTMVVLLCNVAIPGCIIGQAQDTLHSRSAGGGQKSLSAQLI